MSGQIRRRELPSGKIRYCVIVRINGSERQVGSYGRKKDAESRLGVVQSEIAGGTFGNQKDLTFAEFSQEWLSSVKDTVRPRTYIGYEQNVRLHLSPVLGAYSLVVINPQNVQKVISDMSGKGLSPLTVQKALTVLRMILKKAQSYGYIGSNPALYIKPPRKAGKEMDYLIPEEVSRLLDSATLRSKPIFAVAVFAGLRQGEIIALRWQDVNLEQGYISVNHSYHPKQGFTEPKSRAGRRAVSIGPELNEILKKHMPEDAKPSDLVFLTQNLTPIESTNLVRQEFHPALERAGLRRIRFHDLRHTYATLMISLGVNIKALQTWMGHSSIATTLDLYGHLLPEVDSDIQDRLESLVFSPKHRHSADTAPNVLPFPGGVDTA